MIGARIVFEDHIENSDKCTALTPDTDVFGYYLVDTSSGLNLRDYPSTSNGNVILCMPEKHTFRAYGLVDETGDWLLGETNVGGKIYAGFANKNYLIKKGENIK